MPLVISCPCGLYCCWGQCADGDGGDSHDPHICEKLWIYQPHKLQNDFINSIECVLILRCSRDTHRCVVIV